MVAALACAEAASEGAHLKNASRDLLKKFLTPSQEWPKFYMASLPFEHGDFDIPFCLPHMFVEQKILDKEEWQLAAGSPMHRHVGSAVQGPVQDYVPLSLWGDGVVFTKTASMFQVYLPNCPFGNQSRGPK